MVYSTTGKRSGLIQPNYSTKANASGILSEMLGETGIVFRVSAGCLEKWENPFSLFFVLVVLDVCVPAHYGVD